MLDNTAVDGVLGYTIPEEKEDYLIAINPEGTDIDIDPALVAATRGSKSNLRLPPPPLFSRQTIPQIYKLSGGRISDVQKLTTSKLQEESGVRGHHLYRPGNWRRKETPH